MNWTSNIVLSCNVQGTLTSTLSSVPQWGKQAMRCFSFLGSTQISHYRVPVSSKSNFLSIFLHSFWEENFCSHLVNCKLQLHLQSVVGGVGWFFVLFCSNFYFILGFGLSLVWFLVLCSDGNQTWFKLDIAYSALDLILCIDVHFHFKQYISYKQQWLFFPTWWCSVNDRTILCLVNSALFEMWFHNFLNTI